MSAREKLLAALSHTADYHLDYTYPGLCNEEIADQLLSEHAHELAEKIRGLKESQPRHWAGVRIDVAADLIDPGSEAT